jgi:putative addiction module component (TIGR02574 family)
MNIPGTLAEVAAMSVDDRIRLAQAIWDTIASGPEHPSLTEDEKKELDRRLADLDANPQNVLTWEEIKAHIRRQR